MRIRTIKPAFWQSETVGSLSRDARLLMIGMFNRADDDGRFRAHPAQIRGELFPFDEDITAANVSTWLAELEAAGVVQLYAVDGTRYGHFPKFGEHQKIDKRRQSDLPVPNADLVANPKPNKGCAAPALSNHGETERVGMEGNGMEGNGKGATADAGAKARAVARPRDVPDSVWKDFLKLRRAKKAPLTETAWSGIESEAKKARWEPERALRECITRGWTGFKAEWVDGKAKFGKPEKTGPGNNMPAGLSGSLSDAVAKAAENAKRREQGRESA